jgi:hypothetical protein
MTLGRQIENGCAFPVCIRATWMTVGLRKRYKQFRQVSQSHQSEPVSGPFKALWIEQVYAV